MATITYCDKCKKEKTLEKSREWSRVSLRTVATNKLPGIESFYADFEFCPDCGKILLPKILNIINT